MDSVNRQSYVSLIRSRVLVFLDFLKIRARELDVHSSSGLKVGKVENSDFDCRKTS